MVKRRNKNANRQKPRAASTAIARIATGVPVAKRRVPRDPPMLPHVLTQSVRTRYDLRLVQSNNSVGYSVVLGSLPTSPNIIFHYYNPTSGLFSSTGGLTYNEIFTAAAMRIYGVDVTANPGGANFQTTDFAITKVTFYGPPEPSYDGNSISLTVDFGEDIPGFVGRDSSSRNQRAVISTSPPRLVWRKLVQNENAPALSYNNGVARSPLANNSGQNFPSAFIAQQQVWPSGVLDITVMLRRSVIASNTSTFARAEDTKFSDD